MVLTSLVLGWTSLQEMTAAHAPAVISMYNAQMNLGAHVSRVLQMLEAQRGVASMGTGSIDLLGHALHQCFRRQSRAHPVVERVAHGQGGTLAGLSL